MLMLINISIDKGAAFVRRLSVCRRLVVLRPWPKRRKRAMPAMPSSAATRNSRWGKKQADKLNLFCASAGV